MNPWQDPAIASQMAANVDRQLADRPWPIHFTTFADAVQAYVELTPFTVLEVGCGVGHGVRILHDRDVCRPSEYTGIDINEHAIAIARELCPDANWYVADASTLATFEKRYIIIDGSCVLHVDDWRAHLAALCAASRDAVILHRIPIFERENSQLEAYRFETRGYGQMFNAWCFKLSGLRSEMSSHGFTHTETRKADGDSLTLTFRKDQR